MEITQDIINSKENWQGNVIKRFDEKRAEVSWSPFEGNYDKMKKELILPLSKNKIVLEIGFKKIEMSDEYTYHGVLLKISKHE